MHDEKDGDFGSSVIYKNVLQNMQDGVIAIASDGKIVTFNQAAANILMIKIEQYIGQHFTKIFSTLLLDPRNDELNDAILSAIYESKTAHHKDVKYYFNGLSKDLLVSSAALIIESEGASVKAGMIIVISDITQRQRLAHVQNLFGKYVDPSIANRLIEQSDHEIMKANRQVITVSFCDMHDFTSLCEILSPTMMEDLTNLFLSKMSRSVHKNKGVIDKFIGDSIMAFWGFPAAEGVNHSFYGCLTALDQVQCLAELNAEIKALLKLEDFSISLGIGVAAGELIVANVGSQERKNFTVLGNIVNLAARLVGVNKIYGTQVLVTDGVFNATYNEFEFREIDTIVVKGKEQHTTVYELLSLKGMLDESKRDFMACYAQGLQCYRNREWADAKSHFNKALELKADDKASHVMLGRIEEYRIHPPGESWGGVWVIDRK
ncbi:adenylate/guanylate cyclase domain-containing protein [Candidatus Berkiella aquae]|uniref:Adenylate cyclase 1 n=1 Tax=Candidatus Berkiella aquae TaxID=295108 RepID=A0A0Q9YLL3_9GAMM|nr:adenylate/guanylate cyclase domain-containing protein [Candidatus Berkiella aquae]MCS5711587.1 PAS domain-containing protein [Candidatus Berkiella aquae]